MHPEGTKIPTGECVCTAQTGLLLHIADKKKADCGGLGEEPEIILALTNTTTHTCWNWDTFKSIVPQYLPLQLKLHKH